MEWEKNILLLLLPCLYYYNGEVTFYLVIAIYLSSHFDDFIFFSKEASEKNIGSIHRPSNP
jgi:hypothetical protein